MEAVFENITILKDLTELNQNASSMIGFGIFIVLVGLALYKPIVSNGGPAIIPILISVVGVLSAITGIITFITTPYTVDLYVSLNYDTMQLLLEYFDVEDLGGFDTAVVCYITPKPEFYQDVLAFLGK